MGLALEILLGLLILLSFYGAYMASKTWQVYQVLLVMAIFFSSLGFMYLAARALKAHQSWRAIAVRLENDLATVQKQNEELLEGTRPPGQPPTLGIKQLKHALHRMTVARGGAWFDVAPTDAKEGVLTLKFGTQGPLGIEAGNVLFAFDEADVQKGGRYLGEFKVTAANDGEKTVQMTPVFPMTDVDVKQLEAAMGGDHKWAIYATMPVDHQDAFAELDEQAKRAMLPAASVADYLGKNRVLRDYQYLFRAKYQERNLLADAIAKLQDVIQRAQAALEKAQGEIAYRTAEQKTLQADLESFRREQAAITQYAQSLQQRLTSIREMLTARLVAAQRSAAALARWQFQQSAAIDARTSRAAGGVGNATVSVQP